MIVDKLTRVSDAQAITTTAASTSYYDRGSAADAGPGKNVKIACNIGTAFASATSLTIALQTDSDSAFGTVVTLWSSAAIAKAALTASTKINVPGLIGGCKRYLRMNYTVSGTENAGTITTDIGIVDDQNNTPTAGSP